MFDEWNGWALAGATPTTTAPAVMVATVSTRQSRRAPPAGRPYVAWVEEWQDRITRSDSLTAMGALLLATQRGDTHRLKACSSILGLRYVLAQQE